MNDRSLQPLFTNNREWAQRITVRDPEFFEKLSLQQAPEYLWIGCADSRVPANQIIGLLPGDVFVHRNVANVVVQTDLNCLSVIQYAVEVLRVRHVIVCGHYGCGGVTAALADRKLGLIDNWLRHVWDIGKRHEAALLTISNFEERVDRLCELNVMEQVLHVCQTTIVQSAWDQGQELSVHGVIYGIRDGLLKDLGVTLSSQEELNRAYDAVVRPSSAAR